MRSTLFAIVLATVFVAALPAQAAGAELVAGPLPVDKSSELPVGVVNTCVTEASYRIVVKDAADGSVLRSKRGKVAAKRGVAVAWRSDAADLDLVVATVSVTCEAAAQQRAAQPRPLVGVSVRDRVTKVPRFHGQSQEGTGI